MNIWQMALATADEAIAGREPEAKEAFQEMIDCVGPEEAERVLRQAAAEREKNPKQSVH